MMDSGVSAKIFSCRRCRFELFKSEDLSEEHDLAKKCSLLYLSSVDLLPWVRQAVDEAGWTRGKLYCPQCEARIGAFSFLHFIMCQCNCEVMPAVYCVRRKIDEMLTDGQTNMMANLLYEVLDSSAVESLNPTSKNSRKGYLEMNGDVGIPGDLQCHFTDNTSVLNDSSSSNSGVHKSSHLKDMASSNVESTGADAKLPAVSDGHSHILETALARIIANDALGFSGDSVDISTTQSFMNIIQEHASREDTLVANKSVIRRRTPSVTTYRNSCFNPDVLPAYPEVYDEAEFSSKLQEPCDADAEMKCNKKIFYTSHSRSSHLSCCRRCQLLHQQLLRRSENHQRAAQSPEPISDDDASESEFSGSDESVIYAEMIDVQRRLRDLQGYLRDESTAPRRRRRRRRRRYRRAPTHSDVRPNCATNSINFTQEQLSDKGEKIISQEREEEDPSEHHQCPVCLDILFEPHKTACSHIFCAPCLRQIHKISRKKPVCPLCRHRIYKVSHLKSLQDEVESQHPELYRKRLQIEMKRPINDFPLPDPSNVRFDPNLDSDSRLSMQHIFQVLRVCLIIFVMVLTYLINRNVADRGVHHRYASWIKYGIFSLIVVGFAYLFFMLGSWFSHYAVDVSLFAITLCLCYFFIAKMIFDIYRDTQNIVL